MTPTPLSSSRLPLLLPRQRLLDAARGLLLVTPPNSDNIQPRVLKCFPLRAKHVEYAFDTKTPTQFHSLLCHKIRHAQNRVVLASLYVGPAASTVREQPGVPGIKCWCPERELLDSLQEAACKEEVQVRVLLDKHRALRPVPLPKSITNNQEKNNNATTSSAQAVHAALNYGADKSRAKEGRDASNKNNLYLCSVLSPPLLQQLLPNPLNEVAGVFHLKAYIVDDTLILSGANLSREYFVDRHDRYLHLVEGGGGLVDAYADIVQALCDHADVYHHDSTSTEDKRTVVNRRKTSREDLQTALTEIMTTTTSNEDSNAGYFCSSTGNDPIVAVAVPTFQAPKYFFHTATTFPFDTQIIFSLLETAASEAAVSANQNKQKSDSTAKLNVRLSSAYLNPTNSMLQVLTQIMATTTVTLEFLTAGRISHGFAPKKKKAGDKGKDWIPTVFEEVAQRAHQRLVMSKESSVGQQQSNGKKDSEVDEAVVKLRYYNRPGWTFHAKGLWLVEQHETAVHGTKRKIEEPVKGDSTENKISDGHSSTHNSSVAAVVCGSGNYGARSETLDMESNCILILPPDSPLQQPAQQEWHEMIQHTTSTNDGDDSDILSDVDCNSITQRQQRQNNDQSISTSSKSTTKLSLPLRIFLPIIRNFL